MNERGLDRHGAYPHARDCRSRWITYAHLKNGLVLEPVALVSCLDPHRHQVVCTRCLHGKLPRANYIAASPQTRAGNTNTSLSHDARMDTGVPSAFCTSSARRATHGASLLAYQPRCQFACGAPPSWSRERALLVLSGALVLRWALAFAAMRLGGLRVVFQLARRRDVVGCVGGVDVALDAQQPRAPLAVASQSSWSHTWLE